jgi:hypothetical protein
VRIVDLIGRETEVEQNSVERGQFFRPGNAVEVREGCMDDRKAPWGKFLYKPFSSVYGFRVKVESEHSAARRRTVQERSGVPASTECAVEIASTIAGQERRNRFIEEDRLVIAIAAIAGR